MAQSSPFFFQSLLLSLSEVPTRIIRLSALLILLSAVLRLFCRIIRDFSGEGLERASRHRPNHCNLRTDYTTDNI